MKTPDEIRALRSGKGFFAQMDMVKAMNAEGIPISRQSYSNKENGKSPFSAKDVVAMAKILGITLEEAVSFFV